MHLNVEIKARTSHHPAIRAILQEMEARFEGEDHQRDTYFFCSQGRLKLRQGNIENSLIHYQRPDQAGPKASHVSLYPVNKGDQLREVLTQAYGVWKVVEKVREIYFVDNVKIHLDHVMQLGSFVEIEAIDSKGHIGKENLQAQCEQFMALFQIQKADLLSQSYSDMIG